MYSKPIELGHPLQQRCLSLLNLGNMMNLYTIDIFMRVMEVGGRLEKDKLYIHDLQDIVKLGNIINESDQINNNLREDITELLCILTLFIEFSSAPSRPCGMWSMAR